MTHLLSVIVLTQICSLHCLSIRDSESGFGNDFNFKMLCDNANGLIHVCYNTEVFLVYLIVNIML